MKNKIIVLLLLSIMPLIANAQDVIVRRDGTTILSKVLEVNTSEIKYKRFSNQQGPLYIIEKAEVMSINYESGEKDTFDAQPASNNNQSTQDNNAPRYIEKKPDKRNNELILLYDTHCTPTDKIHKNNNDANSCYTIWRVTPSSVMSNDEIEVRFIKSDILIGGIVILYHITIYNKTDRTIYVDKGNSFKIVENGESYCYYDPSEQTSISHGSGSGASIGVGSIIGALGVGGTIGTLAGGIAVGRGKGTSVTTTYNQQRFLAIPPRGKINLSNFKQMEEPPYKIIENEEYFITFNNTKRGLIKNGEVLTYDSDNSIEKIKYTITYSTNSNFTTYSTLNFEVFLYQMIGLKYNIMSPFKYVTDFSNYINGVNEYTIMNWNDLKK